MIAIASLLALPMGATAYAEIKEFTGEVVRANLAKGILDLVKGGRALFCSLPAPAARRKQ